MTPSPASSASPVDYASMVDHLPSGREVSPLASGNVWTEWYHAWGEEMRLREEKRLREALEELNLEYLHDSD